MEIGSKKPILTLEEYDGFLDQPDRQYDLTIDHLNQILNLHGFIKIYKGNKVFIMNAVRSLDLMKPARSTTAVDGTALSCAKLPAEEVRQDIHDLGWQECPISSVVAVTASGTVVSPNAAASSSAITTGARKGRKRKGKTPRSEKQLLFTAGRSLSLISRV